MAQEIIPSSSPALEEVKEQFAKWRQNRKGRESIPDELLLTPTLFGMKFSLYLPLNDKKVSNYLNLCAL